MSSNSRWVMVVRDINHLPSTTVPALCVHVSECNALLSDGANIMVGDP